MTLGVKTLRNCGNIYFMEWKHCSDNDAICYQSMSIKVALSGQIQDGGHRNQVICLIKSIMWDLV